MTTGPYPLKFYTDHNQNKYFYDFTSDMTLDDRGPPIAALEGRQLDQKLKLKSSKIKSRKIDSRCSIGQSGALHDHYKSSEDPNNHFFLKIYAILSIFSIRKS